MNVVERVMSEFIAEIKMRSPFGFKRMDLSPWDLTWMAVEEGDMVAAHTEYAFGGRQQDFEHAAHCAHESGKKILAKGFHTDKESIDRSRSWGADYVLLVGRVPPDIMRDFCIYEPWDYEEFRKLNHKSKYTIMWNERDLATGGRKPDVWDEVRKRTHGYLIQASFISKPSDVRPDADAFIVGEHLPEFVAELKASDETL